MENGIQNAGAVQMLEQAARSRREAASRLLQAWLAQPYERRTSYLLLCALRNVLLAEEFERWAVLLNSDSNTGQP